jgi:hypothetical protein
VDDFKDSFHEELRYVFDRFPTYYPTTLTGDFSANVSRVCTFKPTIGNESLHEIRNENGVRLVNFATSKTYFRKVQSSLITNFINTPGPLLEETQKQIDHILIDKRRHSNLLDVRSFRVGDCDTDHYLVVAKVKERLVVSKRGAQKRDTERFNVKKLNEGMLKNSIGLQSQTSS